MCLELSLGTDTLFLLFHFVLFTKMPPRKEKLQKLALDIRFELADPTVFRYISAPTTQC